MTSVVTLYVVDYACMVSGPLDHSGGWHWRGNIDFDVYVGNVSFNVGNIGAGNVYSFLMRAGSSYSELMAGLGYTDVQEREQLRAVLRRLYRLVVDLSVMVWGGICGQQRTNLIVIHGNLTAHHYLHTRYVVKCIHVRYEWSSMKSHISPLVLLWIVNNALNIFYFMVIWRRTYGRRPFRLR